MLCEAMVDRGDLGDELPIEEVSLLQEEVIRRCGSIHKPVIVATNMLESMINHSTPTRAEVNDIAIVVCEGSDAIMLSGETGHGQIYVFGSFRLSTTLYRFGLVSVSNSFELLAEILSQSEVLTDEFLPETSIVGLIGYEKIDASKRLKMLNSLWCESRSTWPMRDRNQKDLVKSLAVVEWLILNG